MVPSPELTLRIECVQVGACSQNGKYRQSIGDNQHNHSCSRSPNPDVWFKFVHFLYGCTHKLTSYSAINFRVVALPPERQAWYPPHRMGALCARRRMALMSPRAGVQNSQEGPVSERTTQGFWRPTRRQRQARPARG